MSNINDMAVLNEMRRLRHEVQQLKLQMSLLISQSNAKIVYATEADLLAHTGDSTIHFTEASIDHDNIVNQNNSKHIHVGGSAPTGSEILWLDTTPAAPYSTLEMKLSGDSGSTWQRIGIGW